MLHLTPEARTDPRVGFYPGTFDPVTFGHLDIIHRASALFGRLLVGVAVNEGKQPLLDLEARLSALRHEVDKLPHGQRIAVVGFDTLLADAVRHAVDRPLVPRLRSCGEIDIGDRKSDVLGTRVDPGGPRILSNIPHHAH